MAKKAAGPPHGKSKAKAKGKVRSSGASKKAASRGRLSIRYASPDGLGTEAHSIGSTKPAFAVSRLFAKPLAKKPLTTKPFTFPSGLTIHSLLATPEGVFKAPSSGAGKFSPKAVEYLKDLLATRRSPSVPLPELLKAYPLADKDDRPKRAQEARLLAIDQFILKRPKPKKSSGMFMAYSSTFDPLRNVVGVGMGAGATADLKGELCVRLYVGRKLDEDQLPKEALLPEQINGIPVEVIESGRFMAQAGPKYPDRLRPCAPGCSISFGSKKTGLVTVGTLGALVVINGAVHAMSCNHVLARENTLKVADQHPIVQPAIEDKGREPEHIIGFLSDFEPLAVQGNVMDAALARVVPALVTPSIRETNHLKSSDPVDAVEKMEVGKVGRTTGLTKGRVEEVNYTAVIGYEVEPERSFQQQILVRAADVFSEQGDSGSVVYEVASGRPVGLLVGGAGAFSVVTPIALVLKRFGAKLLSAADPVPTLPDTGASAPTLQPS